MCIEIQPSWMSAIAAACSAVAAGCSATVAVKGWRNARQAEIESTRVYLELYRQEIQSEVEFMDSALKHIAEDKTGAPPNCRMAPMENFNRYPIGAAGIGLLGRHGYSALLNDIKNCYTVIHVKWVDVAKNTAPSFYTVRVPEINALKDGYKNTVVVIEQALGKLRT